MVRQQCYPEGLCLLCWVWLCLLEPFVSGSDPALACRSLQRFEVVLQPARSEVKPVGELSRHSCAPCYTAMPCTVSLPPPTLNWGCSLVLMVKTSGRRGKTAARGSVTRRSLLVVVSTEVSTPQGAGIASPTAGSWEVG